MMVVLVASLRAAPTHVHTGQASLACERFTAEVAPPKKPLPASAALEGGVWNSE